MARTAPSTCYKYPPAVLKEALLARAGWHVEDVHRDVRGWDAALGLLARLIAQEPPRTLRSRQLS